MEIKLVSKSNQGQLLASFFFSICCLANAAGANIKCWANEDGVRECGNKIPPEYSQGASVKISRGGVIIGEEEAAKSLETIRKEKEASIKAEESRKADQALLKTFSSTEDLILARNRKVEQIDKEIILLESRIMKLEENLQKVKLRIDANEKEAIADNIYLDKNAQLIRDQIKESQQFIKIKEIERNDISLQFAKDIDRFNKLVKPEK
tara:strand:- start:2187 stop:2810 length:624 start_codon:yes stop_codon:yes gene_type:complete